MVERTKCTLYSGGLKGAESAFGEAAEKWGLQEVTFSYEGHALFRDKNVVMLSEEELNRGDISMELASKMMNRTYYETKKIRKVLQSIFHMVNRGYQVFAVGRIMADNTVKGGTGWAVELARLFNRPVSVFDQEKKEWFTWKEGTWVADAPSITYDSIAGSGTRNLNDDGRKAIEDLFERSFGPA
ncbi:MAG: hypothetical protein ACOY32_05825 [Thermodesulfobacteriota bacterium]